MKRFVRIMLIALLVVTTHTLSASADGGGHGGHGHGGHGHGGHGGSWSGSIGVTVGPWWPWWGGPYYPYYYPYYPAYPQPSVIIRESPDLYVEPAPQPVKPRYWYYCPDARGYYPDVRSCPQGWLKVVPPAGRE
jgi:hypothetical protein